MLVKFIQYWDVLSGKEEEFDTFLLNNYIPEINQSGLVKIIRCLNVLAGEGPHFILEGTSDSVKSINRLFRDEDFHKLKRLLLFLVNGYKTKVLIPTGRFENKLFEGERYIQFNQHYDMNYEKFYEYTDFIVNEHIPALENMGIHVGGEWEVCIGSGPNQVIECHCENAQQAFAAIDSEEYRQSLDKLLTMAVGYGSRILLPTSHVL